MDNNVQLIDMNTLWKCETCFHDHTNGCWTYCDHGESYRPAVSKLKIIDPESLRPVGRWLKNWCDNSLIGHEYEECPYCGCIILDTEKFWDCKYCPNCGVMMNGEE